MVNGVKVNSQNLAKPFARISTSKEQNKGVQTSAPTSDIPKQSNSLEKAMPYIATGVSTVAVGVSAVAVAKSGKNAKNVLKKIEQLETKINSSQSATNVVTPETLKNTTSFIIGILGAATGGAIVNHFDNNKETLKNLGMSDSEIQNHKVKVENAIIEKDNKINKAENSANEAIKKSQDAENRANGVDGKANQALDTANAAMSRANSVANKDGLALKIHKKPWHGLNLMVVNNNEKYMNKSKIGSAVQDINTAVMYRVGRQNGQTEQIISNYRSKYVPLLKSNSTWAITAEYDPIKAGGLGSVPMEIHNNFTDMGIDNPVFIPMYQHKGKGEFVEYGNEKTGKTYSYTWGGDTFNLKKMAEMPVVQYRGNKSIIENVEFFVGHPKRQGIDGKKFENQDQQLIFVKNTDNFGGDIYANNLNADEPEKFAFLSKAVYQLAEAKVSQALGKSKTGLGEIKVVDKEAYDSVKPPVSMLLNDWHAAPMAGLLRYKAPMENAYNVIDDDVKDALRDMPLLMIGHNAGISGGTRNDSVERSDMVTENIINTLYDSYAYGIVENAATGSEYSAVDNAIVYEKDNENDRQFNNLAHGIALVDYYVPVSKNYEKELKSGAQDSGMAFNIIQRRSNNDTISGEINGLDRNLNTTEAKSGWLKAKFGIKLKTYNHHTPIDEVMSARQNNKMEFYDNFLKSVIDKKPPKGGFKYESVGEPTTITRDDFEKAPMIAFAHRLTDQKGLGMFEKAVQDMFNNWDERHPGQPKPFIIAGGELEQGQEAQFLYGLKDPNKYKNPEDINRIQVLKGFMPNPALYAATTYFCAPSTFEPCGLTQGECYAMGTPVITTATGGFVDTIKDGKNGFVAEYPSSYANDVKKNGQNPDEWFARNGKNLASKFDEALDVFFNDKDKYKSIVDNNLHEDLSWNRGSENDPIHGYMKRLAIKNEDNIEADIASTRQFIAPMLKQYDALQNGKMDKETFEKTSLIAKLAKGDKKAIEERDKVYNDFDTENRNKRNSIEITIDTLDKYASDYQDKIYINDKDSSSKGKLDIVNNKKRIESEKLATLVSADGKVENDRRMLQTMVHLYQKGSVVKDEETPAFAEWKNEILSKYAPAA